MNSGLRTLFLATTMVAFTPVAPSSKAMTHGTESTPFKDSDSRNDPRSTSETPTNSGNPPKTTDKSHDKANSEPTIGSPSPAQETNPAAEAKTIKKYPKSKGIDAELRCLALNIYHEARSQSETGQEAVAAVTLNRVNAKSFPDSVCRVVKQGGQKRNRCQFSWWCDGRSDRPSESAAWKKALEIGRESLLGVRDDPTNGALFYHAKRVRPRWSRKFHRTARIGDHIFYRPTKRKSVKVASVK